MQSNISYPSSYWGTAPTSTTSSYWSNQSNQSNQSSNWTYSNWYQVPQSQNQDTQTQQHHQTSTTEGQYNYTQYNTSGGSGQGWSHHTHQNQAWGWSGWNSQQQQQNVSYQQNPPYHQNQWGNQQWGRANQQVGGGNCPGSEAWAGGWSQNTQNQQQQPEQPQQQQQHGSYSNYQSGGYYNQSQPQPPYQYGANYQGQPHGSQTGQLRKPPVDRPSRSPGTPPLQELLSPRANEAGNERGATPGRKHPPPSSSGGEGEPESKRVRQEQPSSPWQARDKYPPLKSKPITLLLYTHKALCTIIYCEYCIVKYFWITWLV